MYFQDEKGINTFQFGDGDIMVVTIEYPNGEYIGVGFGECDKGEIGRKVKVDIEGKKDYEAGVQLKLLFNNAESVDVVLERLIKIKQELIKKSREKEIEQNETQTCE